METKVHGYKLTKSIDIDVDDIEISEETRERMIAKAKELEARTIFGYLMTPGQIRARRPSTYPPKREYHGIIHIDPNLV